MTMKRLFMTASLVAMPIVLFGQGKGIDPAQLLKPLADEWPTHNGDYSGKRYSALKQVNQKTVKNLTLAWVTRLNEGAGNSFGFGGRGGGRGREGGGPVIVGGEGTGEYPSFGEPTIKASALMVDGTVYISTPDNVW